MPVPSSPESRTPENPSLLVLSQAPYPVELLDRGGVVLYGNRAYLRTFRGERALGVGEAGVLPDRWDGGPSRSEVFQTAEALGLWKGEVTLSTSDGGSVCFRVSVFPVSEAVAGSPQFAVFYEDVQAEVEDREAQFHQQNLTAIRSRQTQMGELLSMIAHQWRQPLTVVMSLIGNIQLKARMGGLEPDYLTVKLERISQTVHFLSETIDSFRNYYAPTKFKSEEDLTFLARRALELIGPSLQKTGALVEFRSPLEPVRVRVYTGELIQVLLELISYARDSLAMATGGPALLKFTIEVVEGGAVLKVENNGGAIPAESLPRLFDPYYSAREGGSGAGLGLYMAKLIVENHHGGTLTAASENGWISFVCSLPLGGPV